MKDKKNKILFHKKTAALAALGILVCSVGATWAFYNDSQVLENPLSTSHSGAAIVEDYNPDSSFLPGETVAKKVKFVNTGKMDLFLRVEVPPEEGWYQDGEKTTALETERVIKHWTEHWPDHQEDPKNPVPTEDRFTDDWTEVIEDEVTNRKYRYYKKILAAGEATAEILESIELDSAVSNDRHDADYSNKVYKLTFNAEAIPVEEHNKNLGVQSTWNMSVAVSGSDDKVLIWSKPKQNGN